MNTKQNTNKPQNPALLVGDVIPSLRAKKYNANFERDINWYLSMRHKFNFDGSGGYWTKKGENIIQYDKNGVDGKEAFFQWDSNGKVKPTKHPNLLHALLKIKGSCNLHIKMYAEDRASCYMSKREFSDLCIQFKSPKWFSEAVETQKMKYWVVSSKEDNVPVIAAVSDSKAQKPMSMKTYLLEKLKAFRQLFFRGSFFFNAKQKT